MRISLDSDVLSQLNAPEAKALHDISDSLSTCGVGKTIDLPQIIVVGEQSAGKSSVLEAISHVRFPVKGNLCTRFATELVLRQANETRIDVSVKLKNKWRSPRFFQRTGFRDADLADIIAEATEYMGLTKTGKEFSDDVLRLEIKGPKIYPLSLVDLPGFFHTDTEDQSLSGKKMVDKLVKSYMRQTNNIILMVIAANNNLANQVALHEVRKVDPERQRTIGVITKPDLTRPLSIDERVYIKLAKNQEGAHKLQLRWHVLRNRAEDEEGLEARDKIEELCFRKSAWAAIPREDRGIENLRKKLSRVLYNHIRNSLPEVAEDIETNLRERQEELDKLGKPRSTQEDMRSFLLTIAGDFQRLVRDGTYGRYNDDFFGDLDDENRKFRAQLRNFSRTFDHVLRTKGSTKVVLSDDESEPEEDDIPDYLEEFLGRYPYEFPDPEFTTVDELCIELEKQAAINQGLEFPGSPNKDLAMQLFKNQASPWKAIAKHHIKIVATAAKAFVEQVCKYVVGPSCTNQTMEAILSICVDPFFDEREKVLQAKIDELLRPYAQGYALPLDMEFYQVLSKKSADRFASRFTELMREKHPERFEESDKPRFSLKKITQAVSSDEGLSEGEFGSDTVVDMVMTYYDMARRTFTDNVTNLAIESCLVCDMPDILTPTQVDRMSKERLQELAAETDETLSRRKHLQEEVEILRKGLDQCRRYRPRTVTGE
ncbi:hypothetical protein FSARC_7490 [Fusarium sarcochroum]|uniref:Interferon-induced GTP-binding protein Mx n=1 Tax=Fusarium sarcochroum TaxID=1208366 RepID=A0A8H4TV86_9HYPO|nr:hypothetical protein FSARC_7490 [Fusarium sarcochroum]